MTHQESVLISLNDVIVRWTPRDLLSRDSDGHLSTVELIKSSRDEIMMRITDKYANKDDVKLCDVIDYDIKDRIHHTVTLPASIILWSRVSLQFKPAADFERFLGMLEMQLILLCKASDGDRVVRPTYDVIPVMTSQSQSSKPAGSPNQVIPAMTSQSSTSTGSPNQDVQQTTFLKTDDDDDYYLVIPSQISKNSWQCSKCTFRNPSIHMARCAMCRHHRPEVWQCIGCDSVNSVDSTVCFRCLTRRCVTCTAQNTDGHENCTVCQ